MTLGRRFELFFEKFATLLYGRRLVTYAERQFQANRLAVSGGHAGMNDEGFGQLYVIVRSRRFAPAAMSLSSVKNLSWRLLLGGLHGYARCSRWRSSRGAERVQAGAATEQERPCRSR